MDKVAISCSQSFLDACLLCRQHQFLKLSMGRDQNFSCRCFKGYAPLGAKNGIAQVDAPTDSVFACEFFQRFDQRNRVHLLAVECGGYTLFECQRVIRRSLGLVKSIG